MKYKSTRVAIASALVAAMLLVALSPGVLADDPAAEATRTIDPQIVGPGGTVEVTVVVENLLAEAKAFSLEESIPAGWGFARGVDDAADFKPGPPPEWVWFNIAAGATETVTYTLTVPVDAAPGEYPIVGTVLAGGVENPVGGHTAITVATVTAEATRTIDPKTVARGGTVQVTVLVDNPLAEPKAFALEEDVPAGWGFARGVDDADEFKPGPPPEWVWFNIAAGATETVTYTLTVPVDAALGAHEIDGAVLAGGVENPVGGDMTITVAVESFTVTVVADPPGAAGVLEGADVYEPGQTVTVTAADFAHNFSFDEWTSVPPVTFAAPTAASTTFTMPGFDVTVTANLEHEADTYIVTLVADPPEGGEVSPAIAAYDLGEIVNIAATANPGWEFVEWTTDPAAVRNDLADPLAAATSFEMRAFPVTITAHFELIDDEPPVGGTVYPARTLAVVAPWLALAAAIAFGAILIRRRRAQS